MIRPTQKFSARKFLISIPILALAVLLAIAIFRGTPQQEDQASAPVVREASAKPRFNESPTAVAAALAKHQADFRQWSKARPTSAKDTPETQASRIAAGVALATARRPLMERLIRENPEQAITEALTFAEWGALPPEVQALVEKPFSIVADFDFYPVCTPPGSFPQPGAPEYIAALETMDGVSLETFVYGGRRDLMSKRKLPTQGISLGKLAAMRDGALQALAPAEVPAARKIFDTTQADSSRSFATGETIGDQAVHAVSGGRLLVFANLEEISAANERLALADARPGPVAASSYLLPFGEGEIDWDKLETFADDQASTWTETKKKVFLIRINFSDALAEPVTQAAASAMMNGAVSDSIREQSYGKTWIEAAASANLYTMPQTAAYYANGGSDAKNHELIRDARNTFRNTKSGADASINIGPVSNNTSGDEFGTGDYNIVGITFTGIGMTSGTISYAGLAGDNRLWMQDNNSSNVYIHEFGHNYGISHASSWDVVSSNPVDSAGVSTEYGDIFDIMGGGPDPEGHFHSQAKQKLDWLTATQWQDATALGSNTYRIYRIDDANTTSTHSRGVRITKMGSPAEYYWLSYRPAIENTFQKLGVYLNWQRSGETRCWLLDTTPGSTDGKKDSPIALGRTYSDTAANAHLTTLATGGTGANQWVDVRVNLGPFPGNVAPVAAPITGPATVPARTSAAYATSATDVGDTLAWHWNTKDGSVNDNSSSLAKTWIVGGTYSLDVTVSDMKGGKDTETKTVTVTDPLDTWTPQTSGSTGYLHASVWGKSRFVVAEVFGSIFTSWDGVTWTDNGKLPDFDRDPRLAYGNGMFVVVGKKKGVSTAQICYSSDARTWNVATFPPGAPVPSDVTYANNRFLAVGPSGSLLTSTDGITWTWTTVPGAPDFRRVAWNGTVWMAMMRIPAPSSKANVWTSANGTAWSQKPDLDLIDNFVSVTSHAGVFYATGWDGGITYSTDNGLTWKKAETPGSFRWSTGQIAVADDGTMVVGAKAIDEPGRPQALLVSTNGTQWFRSSAGTNFAYDIMSLTFGFGRFLATSGDGSIRTSGTIYPANTAPTASITTAPTSAPARVNQNFVGSATDAQGDTLSYYWDFDVPGLISDASSTVKSFDFGGNYVATLRVSDGKGGLTTLTRNVTVTDPARTFTQRTSGTTNALHAIAANANLAVAVGGTGGVIRTSPDGITWTTRTFSDSDNITFRGAVWDGLQFVIVGKYYNHTAPAGWQGCIYTSPDGANWTRHFGGGTQRNNELQAVAAGGGGLVAVGNKGAILQSTDGITWSSVTVPDLSSTILEGVAFGGGTYVITGHSTAGNGTGKVFTSTGRTNWINQTAKAGIDALSQDIRKTAYLNNRFVGSGWGSKVRVSTDLGESFTTTRAGHELTPGLAYGANIYFAAGTNLDASDADIDLLSLDGSTWTSFPAPTTDDRNGAVFFKNTFITVGDAGSIWQSDVVTPSSPLPPTLTSIAPATGTTAGGTSVTLIGANFTGATGVTFGGTAATSFVLFNATTITCTTPAGNAGAKSVLVTTPGGTNPANMLFTYVAPLSPPTLTSVSPNTGSTAGGTAVTLTGTNFTGAIGVTIGGTAVSVFNVVNATTITCTTPAGTAGAKSVLVTTPGGTNAANTLFAYVVPPPPPTLTSVSPNTGSTAGGLLVTLTGTNFTGATGVTFGGTAVTVFNVVNATTITCTTPAGTAGAKSVLVTTPGGTNAANTLFTYVTPPPSAINVIFTDNGTDTTASVSGNLNTSFFPAPDFLASGQPTSYIRPELGWFGIGGTVTRWTSSVVFTRSSGGAGNALGYGSGAGGGGAPLTGIGQPFLFIPASGRLELPANYVSGAQISGGAKYPGVTVAGLGIVNTEYTLPGNQKIIILNGNPPPPSPPTLTSVNPTNGSTAGGTFVTLTGTGFTGATNVTFGGTDATNRTVVNATTITCTTPAGTAGAKSVLVTTPAGTNAANTLFTYDGGYAIWIATFPSVSPSLAGFEQDADGDGVDNGTEYFLGTNPGVGSVGLVAGLKNGNTFTFTHQQSAIAATGVSRVYRWSKDLVTFYNAGQTDGVTTVNFEFSRTPGNPTKVTATVTGAATDRLFVDIKVSQD